MNADRQRRPSEMLIGIFDMGLKLCQNDGSLMSHLIADSSKFFIPYIKCEQLLYYFYSVGEAAQANMIKVQQQVSDLLDNADDSAQDLNEWAVANLDYETLESKPVYFHNFKIYQLEETRDIVDFGTARTYAGNKIIIDYDWHPLELNP